MGCRQVATGQAKKRDTDDSITDDEAITMMQGWQGTEDLPDDALQAVEDRTLEIGRYIFDHLDKQRPFFLQRRWWDDRIDIFRRSANLRYRRSWCAYRYYSEW